MEVEARKCPIAEGLRAGTVFNTAITASVPPLGVVASNLT